MSGPSFVIHNADCIASMAEKLESSSIDFIVTSPPFEDLFQYSNKPEDIGNNSNTIDIREGRFALNLRFWIEQLHRVLKPGHVAAIHIQQLLAFKKQHGFMGRRDFRGAMIDLFRAGRFEFSGEFVVAKDPQVMAQQLNLHSLQFKTGWGRDARRLMPAPNDYVLLFTKPGDDPVPVRCLKHERNPAGWYTMKEWIRDACGTWTDIMMTDVLQVDHARQSKFEKHCCPLQLSLIARLVRIYTNPGDLVLDPFMGVGSTAHVCLGGDCRDGPIEEPRSVVGFELKESYHKAALFHASKALASLGSRRSGAAASLFDGMDDGPAEVASDAIVPGSLPETTPAHSLPVGSKWFACTRCNLPRAYGAHPCPVCGNAEFGLVKVDESGSIVPDPEAALTTPEKPASKARKPKVISKPAVPYKLPGGVPPVVASAVDEPKPGQTSFLPDVPPCGLESWAILDDARGGIEIGVVEATSVRKARELAKARHPGLMKLRVESRAIVGSGVSR